VCQETPSFGVRSEVGGRVFVGICAPFLYISAEKVGYRQKVREGQEKIVSAKVGKKSENHDKH
jgi:hypothetical protein